MTTQKTTKPEGDTPHTPAPPLTPLGQARAELLTLRDELKLQVQLGKQEARTLWASLDPALTAAERHLDAASASVGANVDEARLQAHLGVQQLKAKWPSVERGLQDMIDDLRHAAAGARTSLDTTRLKVHLAALDADDLADKAGAELKHTGEELDRQAEQIAVELKSSVAALKKRLLQ